VTVAIALLKFIPETKTGQMLFVGHHGSITPEDISSAVSPFGKTVKIRSVNVTANGTNVVFEVKVTDAAGLVGAIKSLDGVDTVSLVAHDGEFRG
jgi:hypothetical protein